MSRIWKSYFILKAVLISMLFGNTDGRAQSDDERDALIAAHMVGTKEAYQGFLEKHPASPFAAEVFDILANSFGVTTAAPTTAPAKAGTTSSAGAGTSAAGTGAGVGGEGSGGSGGGSSGGGSSGGGSQY